MVTCPERMPSSSVKSCDVSYERPATTGKIAMLLRTIAGSTLYEVWSGGPPAEAGMANAKDTQKTTPFKPVRFQLFTGRLEESQHEICKCGLPLTSRNIGALIGIFFSLLVRLHART